MVLKERKKQQRDIREGGSGVVVPMEEEDGVEGASLQHPPPLGDQHHLHVRSAEKGTREFECFFFQVAFL